MTLEDYNIHRDPVTQEYIIYKGTKEVSRVSELDVQEFGPCMFVIPKKDTK